MTIAPYYRRDQIAQLPSDLQTVYSIIVAATDDLQPGELSYVTEAPDGSVRDYEAYFDRLRHRGHIEYANHGLGYYRAKDPTDMVGMVIQK